jgi:hypothetical protein
MEQEEIRTVLEAVFHAEKQRAGFMLRETAAL